VLNSFKILAIVVSILFFGGCANQEIVIPANSDTNPYAGNQLNQTSIDVSDLNNNPKEQVVARIPFPANEYNSLPTSGDSTVKGVIYLVTATGEKIYGKQTRLYLNPVTSYSKQWYEQSYLGGKKMAKADPRLFNYLKFTTSDANGNFAFYGVPAGKYYVIGVVKCKEKCGFDSAKSIRIAKEITVPQSQTVTIELSKII